MDRMHHAEKWKKMHKMLLLITSELYLTFPWTKKNAMFSIEEKQVTPRLQKISFK